MTNEAPVGPGSGLEHKPVQFALLGERMDPHINACSALGEQVAEELFDDYGVLDWHKANEGDTRELVVVNKPPLGRGSFNTRTLFRSEASGTDTEEDPHRRAVELAVSRDGDGTLNLLAVTRADTAISLATIVPAAENPLSDCPVMIDESIPDEIITELDADMLGSILEYADYKQNNFNRLRAQQELVEGFYDDSFDLPATRSFFYSSMSVALDRARANGGAGIHPDGTVFSDHDLLLHAIHTRFAPMAVVSGASDELISALDAEFNSRIFFGSERTNSAEQILESLEQLYQGARCDEMLWDDLPGKSAIILARSNGPHPYGALATDYLFGESMGRSLMVMGGKLIGLEHYDVVQHYLHYLAKTNEGFAWHIHNDIETHLQNNIRAAWKVDELFDTYIGEADPVTDSIATSAARMAGRAIIHTSRDITIRPHTAQAAEARISAEVDDIDWSLGRTVIEMYFDQEDVDYSTRIWSTHAANLLCKLAVAPYGRRLLLDEPGDTNFNEQELAEFADLLKYTQGRQHATEGMLADQEALMSRWAKTRRWVKQRLTRAS